MVNLIGLRESVNTAVVKMGVIFVFGGMLINTQSVSAQTRTVRNTGELHQLFSKDRISVPTANSIIEGDRGENQLFSQTDHDPNIGPETITITDVEFTGNEIFDHDALVARVEEYFHRPLLVSDLADAALAAAEVYHEAGYFAAQVIVPPQEIINGKITLLVLEGKLDAENGIEIEDFSSGSTSIDYVREILTCQIKAGEVINRKEYERAMLIVENLPGAHLRGRLYPGSEIGTGRLGVEIHQTEVGQGALSYNNYGFYGTGLHQATGSAVFDNALGANERLSVVASTSGKGLLYAGGNAILPVGSDGWTVGLLGSYLEYEMQDEYNTLNEHGDSAILGLEASYPLMLLRDRSTYVTGKVEKSHFVDKEDFFDDFKRNISVAELSLHGEMISNGSSTTYAATGYVGEVDITQGIDSYDTEGGFGVLEIHANHLQQISGNYWGFVGAKAQASTKNLDGYFKCSIGGPNTNRSFAVGEVSADQCITLNTDIRYNFEEPFVGATWQLATFFDYSISHADKNDIAGLTNFEDSIGSVGISANAWWGDSGFVNASLGYQLGESEEQELTGHHADYNSSSVRGWLQAVYQF